MDGWAFHTKEEAIKREKYFKTAAGRRFLKKKLVPYPPVPNGTFGRGSIG